MHHHNTADLYLRLSLDRDGKTAIERQEADCRAWAERNGVEVRKVHIDRGRSGYRAVERKGFDAALTAVTSGVVGILIVWKLDRLSRKGIGEVGRALDDFQRVGGRLVSVIDGLDTANDSARMTIAMLAELARNESRNLGTRVSSAKRFLRQRGQWGQGQPPYGLRVDPSTKKLAHDPETAVYARLIADEALSGTTPVNIARLLNEYDIPAPRGGQWYAPSLIQLLRAPAFAGLMPETEYSEAADGTRTYSARVHPYRDPETLDVVPIGEGIMTVAERDRVIALLESRTFLRAGRTRPHKQGHGLLTGLLVCPYCEVKAHRAGGSYQCRTRRDGGRCAGVSVMATAIDDYVSAAFLTRVPALEPDDPVLHVLAERWVRRADPETAAKREAIELEIADADARLADLEAARYERGEFSGADAVGRYERLHGRLAARINGLRGTLAELPSPGVDLGPLLDGALLDESWEAAEVAGRRDLLRLAIDAVYVQRGRRGARFDGRERVRIVWAGQAT